MTTSGVPRRGEHVRRGRDRLLDGGRPPLDPDVPGAPSRRRTTRAPAGTAVTAPRCARPAPARRDRRSRSRSRGRSPTGRTRSARHAAPRGRGLDRPVDRRGPAPPGRAGRRPDACRRRTPCRSAVRAGSARPDAARRRSPGRAATVAWSPRVSSRLREDHGFPEHVPRIRSGAAPAGSRPRQASACSAKSGVPVLRSSSSIEADQRGLTSIGHGTPARAMKSIPLSPTSPNSPVTASASALARSSSAASRSKSPSAHQAAAVAEAARTEGAIADQLPAQPERPAHRRRRRETRWSRACPGFAPGGTAAGRRAVPAARPRCRGRRPTVAA